MAVVWRGRNRRLLSAALIASAAQSVLAIPAFPGADGPARNVTGGRGGIVYHVTKLDKNYSDTGPGTLRYGLTDSNFASAPRTIVFDVSGTFWLGRYGAEKGHDNGWDTQSRYNLGSNVTVAGQTAPGPVYIMGGVIKGNGTNTILRNVTVAPGYGMRNFSKPEDGIFPTPGDFPDSYVYDAIDVSGTNIMIDHISSMYSTDETISCNELANNLTVQYSNISQGQNYPQADAEASGTVYTGHALASLLQAGTNANIGFHHNLYAHQKGRLPRVGSAVGTGAYNDFRDNVFYNWFGTGGSGASGQPSYNNFVNNLWLAGPGGDSVTQSAGPDGTMNTTDDIGSVINSSGGTGIFSGSNSSGTRVYQSGNVKDTNKDGDANDGTTLSNSDFGSATFFGSALWSPAPGGAQYTGVTDTATASFNRVLTYMGADWWTRDAVINTPDERIINEVKTGTGKIKAWADDPFNADPNEGTEWRTMLSYRADPTTGAAPYNRAANWDTDQDGMPDTWEVAYGLNQFVANNSADYDVDGYTDLEEYINELTEWPAPQPINYIGGANRFALITSWDIQWQPSKYDTAKIASGTATVDAVGQHVGTLLIGTESGNTGTLKVTAGWLRVAESLQVGSTSVGAGTLDLLGGSVKVVKVARIRDTGKILFNGGVLDLQSGLGVFDYSSTSPIATVKAAIASGYNDGSWTGSGISSSAIPAITSARMALGYAEAGSLTLAGGNFFGQSVDSSTVLVAYTYAGDANLDRVVNSLDFNVFLTDYGKTGAVWTQGDFNYDFVVNTLDFNLLAGNFGLSAASTPGASLGAIVPEPGIASVLLGVAGLAIRRRR
jgi:hypothetical protein